MLLSGSSSYGQHQERKAGELFAQRALQERRLKPPDQVVACPRCQSPNTKFCYYNNYSLTQPRHFCKNCRRYWTAGGTLRNVPVGGGCRKNKRSTKHSRHTESAAAAPQHSSASGIIIAGGHGSLDHSNNTSPRAAIAGLQQQHRPFASASSILFDNIDHEAAITFEPSQHTATTCAAPDVLQTCSDDMELPFGRPHDSTTTLGPHHHHQSSQPQQFESSGIMNLGLFNSVLPDTGLSMHSSSHPHHHHHHQQQQQQQQHISSSTQENLSAILDSSTYNRVGALAALTEGLNSNNSSSSSSSSSYNQLHSNGPVSSGDGHETLQATSRTEGGWTNLQLPKHEPLWVDEDSFLQGSLDLNRLHAKGKFLTPALFSHLPTASLGEDAATARGGAAAAAWQQQSPSQKEIAPHYEFTLDTNFWSNNNNISSSSPWSHLDMHALHGLGGGGGRLL